MTSSVSAHQRVRIKISTTRHKLKSNCAEREETIEVIRTIDDVEREKFLGPAAEYLLIAMMAS